MHRLRVSLDRPLHRDGDPYDAEQTGADRLVRALASRINAAEMPEALDVGVTFATAVAPVDGDDRDSLLSRASLRLLALKRASRAPARVYG
jgi:predicted signal transduction protein with EAL and GGDEF domain